MVELPLPKSRPAWLSSLTIILCFFAFYYLGGGYQEIIRYYSNEIYHIPKSGQLASPFEEIKIEVSIPKTIANFGTRWVFVTIINNGDRMLTDVNVWLELRENHGAFLSLPFLIKSERFERYLNIGNLFPNAQVSGRIPVIATSQSDVYIKSIRLSGISNTHGSEEYAAFNEIYVNFGDGSEEYDLVLPPMEFDPVKTLQHSLAEMLLLPPWANGVIPALVLVVSWFVERNAHYLNEDKRGSSLFRCAGWMLFLEYSFSTLAILFTFVLLIVFATGILPPEEISEHISWDFQGPWYVSTLGFISAGWWVLRSYHVVRAVIRCVIKGYQWAKNTISFAFASVKSYWIISTQRIKSYRGKDMSQAEKGKTIARNSKRNFRYRNRKKNS